MNELNQYFYQSVIFHKYFTYTPATSVRVSIPFFLSGSLSSRSLPLPCWLQVELARKEPSRTNEVRLASKDAVTPHSFSLRCFLSRQAAKAQPTAWLSLSPWQDGRESTRCTLLLNLRAVSFLLPSFVRCVRHRNKHRRDPNIYRAHRFMGVHVCRHHTLAAIKGRDESQRPVQDFSLQLIPAICIHLLTSLLCIVTLLAGSRAGRGTLCFKRSR